MAIMSAKSRNPDVRMQAVTSNNKASTEGVEDPDYENMTFAFKHQDKVKSRAKLPRNLGPAQRGHPSGPVSAPHCLNKAILSLYILLAVTFIFLSAFILYENTKMSKNLTKLTMTLWDTSNSVKDGQKNQTMDHDNIVKEINKTQMTIQSIKDFLSEHKKLLNRLETLMKSETMNIKSELTKIMEKLSKTVSSSTPSTK